MHLERAGDDTVELSRHDDEAREDDDRAAIAVEERLNLLQPRLGDADAPAIAQHDAMAAVIADGVADIVADHRARPSQRQHQIDVEPAPRGDDRAGDEQGLSRCRHAEILEQDPEHDGPIAIMPDQPRHLAEELVMHLRPAPFDRPRANRRPAPDASLAAEG